MPSFSSRRMEREWPGDTMALRQGNFICSLACRMTAAAVPC
jgi:hypothetical protein